MISRSLLHLPPTFWSIPKEFSKARRLSSAEYAAYSFVFSNAGIAEYFQPGVVCSAAFLLPFLKKKLELASPCSESKIVEPSCLPAEAWYLESCIDKAFS